MTTYAIGGAMGGAAPGGAAQMFPTFAGPESPIAMAGEQLIADEVLRQQAAARLQHVYRWIETTAPVAPQVLNVASMLITAVQLYEAQQYAASLDLQQAAIGLLRQAGFPVPMLPPR